MRKILYPGMLAALCLPAVLHAQNLQFDTDAKKATYIMPAADTITVGYANDMATVPIMSNTAYSVANNADWLKCIKEANGNLTLFADYYYDAITPRTATITLTSEDGTCTRDVIVKQSPNSAAAELKGDTKLTISTATASEAQPGNPISLSYDGDPTTFWHSTYSGGSTTKFPVTLTYTLKDNPHVDYLTYTPRQDNEKNGNFGKVTVAYTVTSAPSTWVTLTSADFEGSSGTSRIDFGENGVDDVRQVRITVSNGANNFACCAEMGFYAKNNELQLELSRFFEDNLCSQLKSGITEADLASITNPYVYQLVHNIMSSDYSRKYRVGEFEAYRTLGSLSAELKTGNYNAYENPTGIYFTKGESIVLFVEGIKDAPVSLIIKSFGENQNGENHPQSTYPLSNGVNVITASNRGNGYISYYTDKYATASPVRIHFAMARENGYFDLQRGDTNEDWKKMLANATSDIIDIRTQRMQVAAPLSTLKKVCPEKGVELATIYDNVIYREREILGLAKYGREPKNRQFARPVDSGMFADGIGAAADFGSFPQWTNPDDFGFWGFGHELGHVNQVNPGLKWVGCGETTNNIYSAWVEHTLGSGYHRLEDENSGIDSYSGLRGGRFETYLEEGVRKGISWQLQDGPDYHGTASDNLTVQGEDYDGNRTGTVQTTSRNYDHFVKVVPFWQLTLYTQQAEKSVDAFAKVIEGIRTYPNESRLTNGQLQMKFMRSFCDSTKINFLPFFEKAGMLKPIDAYIEDYTPGWLKISQSMIDELKSYIAEKNYPEAPAALNYINAYNWEVFRDGATLTQATLNEGCTNLGNGRIQVDNDVWKNAIGYETYAADGTLLRISMFGLGASQQTKRYTQVLWPSSSTERAAYIMAVGFDGTRVKCYEP